MIRAIIAGFCVALGPVALYGLAKGLAWTARMARQLPHRWFGRQDSGIRPLLARMSNSAPALARDRMAQMSLALSATAVSLVDLDVALLLL